MPRKKMKKNDARCVPRPSNTTITSTALDNKSEVETSELGGEEKLERELSWCIDQLRIGLLTQKATPQQVQNSRKVIKTLSSTSAPLGKKRQVMRQTFGDYRKRIVDEEIRWRKDAERLRNNTVMRPSSNSSAKGMFFRVSRKNGRRLSKKPEDPSLHQCARIDSDARMSTVANATESGSLFKFNFDICKD